MSTSRKLLVLRPGSIDRAVEDDLASHHDFRTYRLDSLDCVRRTSIGVRYGLDPNKICDLVVLPFSELSCVRLIEGSPPEVIAYGPVERMESAFLLGTGDYLAEPWSPAELVIRSRRILGEYPDSCGLDYYRGGFVRSGRYYSFTDRERRVFEVLRRHHGRIVDRETLAMAIGLSPDRLRRGSRALDMVISRMRRVLADSGTVIETIRGTGYRLRVDNRWINTDLKNDERENL